MCVSSDSAKPCHRGSSQNPDRFPAKQTQNVVQESSFLTLRDPHREIAHGFISGK